MKHNNQRSLWYYFRPEFKTVQGKITASLLIVAFLMLSISWYPIHVYEKVHQRYEQIIAGIIPTKYYCSAIEVILAKTNSALDNYLLTSDKYFVQKRNQIWQKDFRSALDSLLTYTKSWENNVATSLVYDISVKANSLRTEQDLIERKHSNKLVSDDLFGGESKETRMEQLSRIDILIEDIINQLENLIELQEEEIVKIEKQNREDLTNLFYEMMILILFVVAIGIIIGSYTIITTLQRIKEIKYATHEISIGQLPEKIPTGNDEFSSILQNLNVLVHNLSIVKQAAIAIGKKDFSSDFNAFQGEGVLGKALAEMKNSLKAIAEDDAKRNWVNTGIAKFAALLSEHANDLDKLCNEVILELVKYLGASQGLIYVSPPDSFGQKLELKAWYAYDRHKYRQRTVEKGEGIVGEVFQEKKSIYITDVPDHYLYITSGLGESKPRALFVVPLKVGDTAYGIIELASFKLFENYQLEFVEKICESIASAIINLENNEKTRKLLETAQMTTEMMRAQEEEMRQNMEELQATQEELNRQKRELDAFVNAINISTILIELDTTGVITYVNEKFCNTFGYSSREVIGNHYSFYVPKEERENANIFEQIIQNPTKEEYFMRDVRRLRKDGSSVWLRVYYFPILDTNGKVKKVTCICADITQEIENKKLLLEIQNQDITKAQATILSQQSQIEELKRKIEELSTYKS
ncbi:MAG: PAS domain S-box protein [Cytophagales bacterium]|nr:PAS domain S-box protein [Cytophagales bacterium]MDW8383274.1 PAS domain S-box protein [Flammeovirgaceae bacterium]